ncbi:hypothetical protein HKX48_006148 [Thoreauomyces humboldtii]|nr:hypothetical protein HKX48_006148 [Thoreauomyces humboldtii]
MFVPVPGSSSVLLVAGDRKLEKISGSWFSDVAVGGATEVDTYLFHTKPPLTDVQHLSKHVDIKLERGSFHYVRYDLQPGSTVQITWKFQDFTQPPTFGIIEGTQMFNSWQTGGGARWSYDRNVGAGKYTFKAPHRESFYLVFYMQRSWLHATGVADFEVDSRTYAIEKPVDHCPAGSKDLCVFPLARNENSYLLFVAPPQEDAYTVTYRTHARWNVYFALIATASSMTFLCCVGSILARCFCGFGRNRASRDATLRQEYEALADESGSRTHHSASPLLAPGSAESPALPAFNPEFPGGANAPPAVPSAPPPYSVFDPTAR